MAGQSIFVDARSYGARCDVRGVTDAATSGAVTTVTSATAAFTAADTGRTFVLRSSAGAVSTGTLTYIDATSATMSVAAGGAMSGAELFIGTNDATAWQDALDAALPGQVVDASGFSWRSLVDGSLSIPNGVHLGFDGRAPFDPQTNPARNAWGPTFCMVQDATNPFIELNTGSGLGDVMFYSLNQKPPASSAPTAFAPVVTTNGIQAGCWIGSPYFANVYIGIDLRGGRHHVGRPQIGAFLAGLTVDESYDVVDIDWITCHPFWRICEGQAYTPTAGTFDEWVQDNGVALVIHRADSLKVGSVFSFGYYNAVLAVDSTIEQGAECGYGMIGMVDADHCVVGIQAYELNTPGLLIGAALLGANGTGVGTAGSAGVATMTGGSVAPKIVVKSWSHRGSWSSGASVQGSGTTLIVPATNPG